MFQWISLTGVACVSRILCPPYLFMRANTQRSMWGREACSTVSDGPPIGEGRAWNLRCLCNTCGPNLLNCTEPPNHMKCPSLDPSGTHPAYHCQSKYRHRYQYILIHKNTYNVEFLQLFRLVIGQYILRHVPGYTEKGHFRDKAIFRLLGNCSRPAPKSRSSTTGPKRYHLGMDQSWARVTFAMHRMITGK